MINLPDLKFTQSTGTTDDTIEAVLNRVRYELKEVTAETWYNDEKISIDIHRHNMLELNQVVINISFVLED